jgi:hypothetical protein
MSLLRWTRTAAAWTLAAFACAAAVGAAADTPPPASQPESRPAESQPATQPSSAPAASAPASAPGASQPASATATSTASASSSAPAEKPDEFLAITGGTVCTVSGPVLRNATILCKNGRIQSIGDGLKLPTDCTVVDATGLYVYPGLIAADARGLHGGTPVEDTTDIFSFNMEAALAAGITCAIAGNDVAKLTFGSTEGMIVKRSAFLDITNAVRSPTGRAELRRDLDKVRGYLRDAQKYEIDKALDPKNAKEPDKSFLKGKYNGYLKLLKRETTAVVNADVQHMLVALADLAREYDFRLVVRGAREAWTVPTRLAAGDLGFIITPRDIFEPDPRLNRLNGSSIESARILMDHGMRVAVVPPTRAIGTSGLGGRDLLNLNMEAAFAVRGGLSNAQGVRTLTIDPAWILGVDERVGSLEAGKDADIIVTDGDLLHYMTHVQYTIVNGKVVYDKEKSSLFRHIRPRGGPKDEVPQFDDIWPRRLTWPEDGAGSRPYEPRKKRAESQPASAPAGEAGEAPAGDTEAVDEE